MHNSVPHVSYLDDLVPAAGDNDGVQVVGTEADARHPVMDHGDEMGKKYALSLTTRSGLRP